jgi:hypothetical protein
MTHEKWNREEDNEDEKSKKKQETKLFTNTTQGC